MKAPKQYKDPGVIYKIDHDEDEFERKLRQSEMDVWRKVTRFWLSVALVFVVLVWVMS